MTIKADVKLQYWAGLCVNLISLSVGTFVAWPSASFLVFQSAESPLKTGRLSNDLGGTIVAMYSVGGTLGAVVSGWLADKIGLKRALQFAAVPIFIAWLILPFATNPTDLLLSRVLGGFTSGAIFNLIPLFISDLADDSVRGILGTFLVFGCNIGVLWTFVLNYYLHFNTVAWINFSIPLIYLVLFSFLPESPRQLLLKNNLEKAEKSYRFFRNLRRQSLELPETFKAELQNLKNEKTSTEAEESMVRWADFMEPLNRKTFLICLGLMALNIFCGCFSLLNYTGTIFKNSGSSLPPNLAAIIVGVIQLIGSYVATFLVERAGRKILLLTSSLGCGIGLVVLGGYTFLAKNGFDMSDLRWIPIASFSFTIFIGTCGVLSLPFLVIVEILPPKIRDRGSMLCMVILWALSFYVLRYLPLMTELIGMHGVMWTFSFFSFLGAIFIIIYLPETKGKSIDEVLSMIR